MPMTALVVYDSFFGNTELIAQAVGQSMVSQGDVPVRRASEVTPGELEGLELLVVGSPTRGFRPSESTMSLLKSIPSDGLRGVKVAAFDTRVRADDIGSPVLRVLLGVLMKWFGYAAGPIADRLKAKGGQLVSPPEGFYVEDTEGPLKEGELQRAEEWARLVMAG